MSWAKGFSIANAVVNVANGLVQGYVTLKSLDKDLQGNQQVETIKVNEKLDPKTEKLLQDKTLSEIERNKLINVFLLQKIANKRRELFQPKTDNTIMILTSVVAFVGILAIMIKSTKK